VTVIDSGDELAADAEACGAHQLPASNGAMLSALVREHLACPVTRSGPVADRLDALLAAFEAAGDADVIVTSGGASVGDHDLIRPALEAWGADIEFWRVAIKPGKPILVARRGAQLVIGLPGNPVSSFVTAFLFVLPVLRRMAGASRCLPQWIPANLAVSLAPGGNRQEFLRASWDGFQVSTQRVQDSSALASLAFSNALIDRPAGAPAAPAGCSVPVYLLGNGGIA
jgi:molybdopterin molybdotransferase